MKKLHLLVRVTAICTASIFRMVELHTLKTKVSGDSDWWIGLHGTWQGKGRKGTHTIAALPKKRHVGKGTWRVSRVRKYIAM